MTNVTTFRKRTLPFIAVMFLSLSSFGSAKAATHIIIFGGEVGLTYSPNALDVQVGDVITWQGDFSMHPLHFEIVPDGATKPADVTSGDAFSYTVEVAGQYGYYCNFHKLSGMIGGFQTAGASVDRPLDLKMLSVFPNPVNQDSPLTVELGFNASTIEQVNLCTSDGICGSFVPGGGYRIEGSQLIIPNLSWGAGAYVLSVVADGNTYRRKIIITR
jgi:plastocyanin